MSQVQALEDQLRRLHSELNKTVAAAQRRKSGTLIVMLVAIVAMAIYLSVAYYKVAEFDSKTVILSLESYARETFSRKTDDLAETMKDYAPQAIDKAEKLIRAMPGRAVDELKTQISAVVAKAIPELEAEMVAKIQEAIEHAKASSGDGKVSEEAYKKILDDLAAVYGKQVDNMINQVDRTYRANSNDFYKYLRGLADGQGLDDRQRHHRRLIISFLQLMEKWDEKAS